jgi:ribosome-binding protein aMBF1 (putative translation factor)
MKVKRTYSAYSIEAMYLLGTSIRAARKEKKMSETELAERAGVARSMVQRVEKGDMSCGVGTVFELATITGILLFGADNNTLSQQVKQVEDKLTLLPKAIRKSNKVINDDF